MPPTLVAPGTPARTELLEYLRQMYEIRFFEQAVYDLLMRGLLKGTVHLYAGEEAVAVGALAPLTEGDLITSTHRGHGHCLVHGVRLARTPEARQAHLNAMMAEVATRETGYSRGRGGSMHIADVAHGNLGATGIVGGNLPVATGAGLALQLKRTGGAVLCFFGDGAANNGVFHEALNMAAVMRLPHGAEMRGDAVVLAGLLEHGAAEVLAVVAMDGVHDAPHRPRRSDVVLGEPDLLRQNGVRQTQADRKGARRIEGDVKPRHHAAVNINGDRDPWFADRPPVDVVDQFEIDWRVIDLHEPQRRIGSWKRSFNRREALPHGLTSFTPANLHALLDCGDAPPDCGRVWSCKPRADTAGDHFSCGLRGRQPLLGEIALFDDA